MQELNEEVKVEDIYSVKKIFYTEKSSGIFSESEGTTPYLNLPFSGLCVI